MTVKTAPVEEKAEEKALLRNPKWEAEKVGFNEETDISIEAECPKPKAAAAVHVRGLLVSLVAMAFIACATTWAASKTTESIPGKTVAEGKPIVTGAERVVAKPVSKGRKNPHGATGLLKAAARIRVAAISTVDSGRVLHRFTAAETDSLRRHVSSGFISNSLLATPPPWDVAIEISDSAGHSYTALYYGDVLRVNRFFPRSTRIEAKDGTIPAPGIADLVLTGEGSAWLSKLVGSVVGTPPSKPHRTERIPLDPY